jgi:ABC-type nitrate/sulfonate/bicarbonate transport system substrate-binding protein
MKNIVTALMVFFAAALFANAEEPFAKLVGNVNVQPVAQSDTLQVPFITWGGDVATFQANGGLVTTNDSIYKKSGLNVKLFNGDNFVKQVQDYMAGKTPFLRGTMRMLAQASEVLGSNPQTKPTVILQLSWSAGDHIVSRKKIESLNDLKGAKIVAQQGGPHVGLIYDALDAAFIDRNDVTIVWVKDLTGDNGPAEAFRNDPSIDACCVITPDMMGLCGSVDGVGTKYEGNVEGSHVVVSTQSMSRSVADVYAVRTDWYKANRDVVEKFVAGYLKGTENVVAMRKEFDTTQKLTPQYKALLNQSQKIFGEEVIPDIEVDGHGLLLDCSFVGLVGQVSFFEDDGNPNNFDKKMTAGIDMATSWGYTTSRRGFNSAGFDYKSLATLAGVQYVAPSSVKKEKIKAESFDFFEDDIVDANTIVSFTIGFKPNQQTFSIDQYGADFERAVKASSTFGNAAVVITGHSDPTRTLVTLLKAGIEKGVIRRTGSRGSYRYFFEDKSIDPTQTGQMIKLINTGSFDGSTQNPRGVMQAALNLSVVRATKVKEAIEKFAADNKINLDMSQIVPVGAGISDPVIPKPTNKSEAMENMRVEFKIIRMPAEALEASDFDF